MEEPGLFNGIFAPIEYLMTAVLNVLYSLTEMLGVPSYGLAIILLTVLIKILNAENPAADEKVAGEIQGQSQSHATKIDGALSKRGRKSDVGLPADADSNADIDGHVLHAVQF